MKQLPWIVLSIVILMGTPTASWSQLNFGDTPQLGLFSPAAIHGEGDERFAIGNGFFSERAMDEESGSNQSGRTRYTIGLKLGLTRSTYYTKSNDIANIDYRLKDGFAGGIFSAYSINRFFVIQPEFLLVQMGTQYTLRDVTIKETLTYFEIPILFKLILTPWKVKPHVLFGPYVATLLKAEVKDESSTQNITDDANRGDAGYLLGLGIDFVVWGKILNFDFRYSQGFVDVLQEILRNKSTAVTVGFYF